MGKIKIICSHRLHCINLLLKSTVGIVSSRHQGLFMGRNNLMMSNFQKLYIPLPQNKNLFSQNGEKIKEKYCIDVFKIYKSNIYDWFEMSFFFVIEMHRPGIYYVITNISLNYLLTLTFLTFCSMFLLFEKFHIFTIVYQDDI